MGRITQPLIGADVDFVEVEGQPGYYISRAGRLYSNYAKEFSRRKIGSYKHSNTKLSDVDILRIYKGEGPLIKIAAKYGTSARTVFNIKKSLSLIHI